MPMLTIKEAAAELRVSPQWLQYWLVANPVDVDGVPFYITTGRRKKFDPEDIDRIIAHLRVLEAAKLGPSVKSKVRLVGLMSQVGGIDYEERLRQREADKQRKEAEKAKRPPQRRVRLPSAKRPPQE
jgi:DNA-binding transcriptional MerR regulator